MSAPRGILSAMSYDAQDRGDAEAYARYLAGMDASMRQKVALTAAHLLGEGRVADMGCGSGAGSAALARLYPRLEVLGLDVNARAVARAAETHIAPNLRFELGDAAAPELPEGSLDAIFDSSMLHHVTSFNGYAPARAAEALAAQARLLREGGVLIVRDFLDPGPGELWLELPADDGDDSEDPRSCSSAALLERFAREFRVLLPEAERGFPLRRVSEGPPLPEGWRRYALSRTHAAEFALRKDYRADWALEVQEAYTYFTQAEFEEAFAALGLRPLASTPLHNPWIVQNRFEGRLVFRDPDSHEVLDWPATNAVLVGERPRPGQGVRFTRAATSRVGFLVLEHYRDTRDGQVYDLVRRPNSTVDIVPWFQDAGQLYVVARMSYPRPLLTLAEPALDGARAPAWITEPLVVRKVDMPLGKTVERALARYAELGPDDLLGFERGAVYTPSPGGLLEEVQSMLVEITPRFVEQPEAGVSGFSSSGRVAAVNAQQLLRAAQVGGLPDARLEQNTALLLRRRGLPLGPWIGEPIALEDRPPPPVSTLEALDARPRRRVFREADPADSSGFLELQAWRFEERDAQGQRLLARALEAVLPRPVSGRSACVAVLRRSAGRVYIAVQDHDLPAAQCFSGHSDLRVAPAWRLPHEIRGLRAAEAFLRARLAEELGVTAGARLHRLGGHYHPAPGSTPEVVHPFAVEALGIAEGRWPLLWVELSALVARLDRETDGHLRVLALRAAHALGL
ncbi:MAG: methyltransferase domain-containing protein [Alphaproteobacteria bacterium]|nr:methyltransferase domain-containing protein [Alphaproteobacteria bacterium]